MSDSSTGSPRAEIAAAIIASSEDAIYSKSLDGIIQSWNPAAARMYGYSAEEVLGRPVTLLLPPEHVEEERDILRRLARGERIERYDTERLRKDGTCFAAQLTISPIHDEEGRIVAASTSTQDITDRKRAERQSRFLAAIVESSEEAIYSKSLSGIIQSWNAAAARVYGYSAEEIVGRPVTMLLPPEHVEEEHGILARLAGGQRIERYETERLRKDGRRFEAQLTISPIYDERGTIVAASTSTQDITDRRRAERQQVFLVNASDIVASARSVDELLGGLGALVAPALGDWCIVDLIDDTGALRTAAVVHQDPAKVQQARELFQRLARDARAEQARRRVLVTRRAELYPAVPDDARGASARDPEILAGFRGLGYTSAVAVPLVARGRSLGVLSALWAESRRRYSADDLRFMEQLGQRVALGIDNIRLHEAESEARRAAEVGAARIGRLQAFTAALSEALTPQQVGEATVDHITAAFGAAAAAVSLLTEEGAPAVLASRGYPSGPAGTQCDEAARIAPLEAAMRSGRVVWYRSWAEYQHHTGDARATDRPAFAGALAAAPVMLHGRALGGFSMNFAEQRRFGAEEVEFMLTFGRQCAQAVERARLYAREHQVASTLQQALLPASLPEAVGVSLDAAYRPATRASDVGGDWYDVFRLPDGRLCAAIGDVVGHGIEAAVIMGQMRQTFRTAALEGHEPAQVLQLANQLLRLNQEEGMTTAIVGTLDPLTKTFVYAAAGHPGPILASRAGVTTLPSGGLPIGFFGDAPVPSWTVQVPPGALLVFYTDGLVEFARDPAAGHGLLVAAIQDELGHEPGGRARRILDRVLGGAAPLDDIAVVVLSTTDAPVDRLDVTLPADPLSLRLARQAIHQLSAGVGIDEARAFALNVAVGEAVNNVIEHAYGAGSGVMHLRARRENSTLQVEIEDAGRWRPDRPQERIGGRGFKLMRALVDSVQAMTTERGTTVRLTMGLEPAHVPAAAPNTASVAGHGGAVTHMTTDAAHSRPRRIADTGPDGASYDVEVQSGTPTVIPAGDVDLANIAQFVRTIEEAAAKAPGLVVLVLDRVSYFDSQGVRALLQVSQRLSITRRKLAIVAPAPSPIRRLLDVAGLQGALPVFNSVDDAVRGTAS